MRGGGGPFLLRARRSLGEHEQRSKSRMVLKETLSIEALQNEVFREIQNQILHFISIARGRDDVRADLLSDDWKTTTRCRERWFVDEEGK
jgi:hypothetical protein